MSAPASRRPQPKGKVKVGICENHNYLDPKTDTMGDCPKCASGEKLKVEVKRISDFRCPVCGGKLTPVKEPVSKWVWIGAGLAGVAAIAITCVCLFLPKEEKKIIAEEDSAKVDTVQVDTVVAPESAEPADSEPKPKQKEEKTTGETKVSAGSSSVLGGAAMLVTENGYKTLKFKRSYQLDLGKSDGSALSLNPNDEIYMANIRNGYLYGGQLKRASGVEEALSGLKVKL